MARSRNIKPSIFKNEVLGEADPLLSLLFMGLWCLADREGRLEDRPKRIKAEIFPYREIPDINGYLTELASLEFIHRYTAENQAVIQVINFKKHQSPHRTEKPSTLPEKPNESKGCALTVNVPLNNESVTVKESLIPDSLIPDSLKGDAAAPPTIWDAGVAQGLPRSLVGRWIKDHGEGRTAEVIAKLAVKRPADPVQFGTALLQDRPEKLFVPKLDSDLVPFAQQHSLPEPGKTETYDEYRRRLWPLVKDINKRMTA